MKKSKPTKSTEQYKILRMISRDEQFERNGGGQFVSMNRAYKNKVKYNRNDKKKELRGDLSSYFFFLIALCIIFNLSPYYLNLRHFYPYH